ncbi:MAG: acyl-CoA thioesterase [Moraxellaceae bacterium]|nr:acyl-CoA thioesterase [Moraxellaceae bacterium]
MSQKIFSKEVDIEVPFHDADMMYVAWHGHYLKYFEIARCALLDTFSYNYMDMMASGYAWPIIEAHLRYPGSALFGQTIRVKATLTEWENRLRIEYLVTDAASGKRLTTGYTIQVAVNINTREMLFASPSVLLERLGVAE